MHSLLNIDIPRDARAPGRARRAVEAFADDLGTDAAADVKLMVSELISNSVKYGGAGEISLALRSIADIREEQEPVADKRKRANSIKVLRYGVKTRAYGVN